MQEEEKEANQEDDQEDDLEDDLVNIEQLWAATMVKSLKGTRYRVCLNYQSTYTLPHKSFNLLLFF